MPSRFVPSLSSELEHLYKTAPVGLCLLDTDLRFVRINERLAAINGKPASEHIGKRLSEILPKISQQVEPIYRKVIETGEPALEFEVNGVTPSDPGIQRNWLVSYIPVLDIHGSVIGVSTLVQEVTDGKRAEKALRASEERFRAICEHAPVMIDSFDENGRIVFANLEMERTLGWTSEELMAAPDPLTMMYPDPKTRQNVLETIQRTDGIFREYEVVAKDGSHRIQRWADLRLPNGASISVGYDVTEGKKAELALRESETKFRVLAETTAAAIFIFQGSELIYANRAAAATTGYDEAELRTMSFWHVIHPDFQDLVKQRGFARQTDDDIPQRYEVKIVTKQGDERWIDFTGKTFLLDEKPAVLGTAIDITERKLAENAVVESERRLRDALEVGNMGYLDWNILTNEITWSRETYQLYGFDPERFQPDFESTVALVHPDDLGFVQESLALAVAGTKEYNIEHRMVRADGKIIYVHAKGSMVRNEQGEAVRMLGTVIDITERKQAQLRLQEANKLLEQRVAERTRKLETALAQVERLKEKLEAENIYLQAELEVEHPFAAIIGASSVIKEVRSKIDDVAQTDATVLLQGETGTGKELVAHAIHRQSHLRNKPFVKVNCAALSPTLIESELFGHEKGAFTGAGARRLGRFEVADGGTIFLDEIADLPLELQPKLLRVLQIGEFERLGSHRTHKAKVRVVAACNRNLLELVRLGQFREDLFFRLNLFPIMVPPLRDRGEDILLLASHFLKKQASKFKKNIQPIHSGQAAALKRYPWPGNVRELENVIERAVIVARTPTLKIELSSELNADSRLSDNAKSQRLEDVERHHILQVLDVCNWVIEGPRGAAQRLDLNPGTLRARMRKLKIRRE